MNRFMKAGLAAPVLLGGLFLGGVAALGASPSEGTMQVWGTPANRADEEWEVQLQRKPNWSIRFDLGLGLGQLRLTRPGLSRLPHRTERRTPSPVDLRPRQDSNLRGTD